MNKSSLLVFINCCLLSIVFSGSVCLAQSNTLQIFEQFMNKEWMGHYVDSDDSLYVHNIKWEYILNSKGVKETKKVPELGFEMETYYYYDWEKNQISCLSLLNKEMNSTGKVLVEGSKMILEGQSFYKGGSSEFRKTYEITPEGKLTDKFYRKKGDDWVRGHLIEYE